MPWHQVELGLYGVNHFQHTSSGVDEDFAKGEARQWIIKVCLWVKFFEHSNVGKLYYCNYKQYTLSIGVYSIAVDTLSQGIMQNI